MFSTLGNLWLVKLTAYLNQINQTQSICIGLHKEISGMGRSSFPECAQNQILGARKPVSGQTGLGLET